MDDIVIAGGSIAGFTAAGELRSRGFEGRIRIVGDEPVRTYQRPPLSKGVLAGDDPASTAWKPAASDDLEIDWLLGERAVGLDLGGRTVQLASGDALGFDGLVIATGATPRRLPGQPDLAGVHVVRSLEDSLGLRADLDIGGDPAAVRVVVVGAGFIGAEVAATCRDRGHPVTVVEPLPLPLVRIMGETIGTVVADEHRARGVDLRLGVGVERLEGDDRVERVVLGDGSVVEADVVVIGIGVVPNTGWLEGSGIAIGDGVEADATTLVAPGVTAAGDVASWDSPRYGRIRVEHWDHAVDMGRAAARRLLASDDEAEAFDPVPWFWSDQYGYRLQLAGRAVGEPTIVDGSVEDRKFLALYESDGWVAGAFGWNWPPRVARMWRSIDEGIRWADAVG